MSYQILGYIVFFVALGIFIPILGLLGPILKRFVAFFGSIMIVLVAMQIGCIDGGCGLHGMGGAVLSLVYIPLAFIALLISFVVLAFRQ